MCLITKITITEPESKLVLKIASKDLECFKLLKPDYSPMIFPGNVGKYIMGQTYKEPIVFVKGIQYWEAKNGLYSFYNPIWFPKDAPVIVKKFIIPKGAQYYTDFVFQYVSDTLLFPLQSHSRTKYY